MASEQVHRVGGLTQSRPADADAIAAANAVRAEVESKAGGPFTTYNPTEVATQVRFLQF